MGVSTKKKKIRAADSALTTCKLKETQHANSKTQVYRDNMKHNKCSLDKKKIHCQSLSP